MVSKIADDCFPELDEDGAEIATRQMSLVRSGRKSRANLGWRSINDCVLFLYMGKGHYHGGETLVGFGTTTGTSKGGGRGLNLSSSPADKQKVRLAERKRKKAVNKQIAVNEMLVKQLSDQWLAEKRQLHYKRLVLDEREKASPLAAALRAAMKSKEEATD